MRNVIREQVQVGEIDIVECAIELTTRNEIPQQIRGLPAIQLDMLDKLYCNAIIN
jgi:hypothetical protein